MKRCSLLSAYDEAASSLDAGTENAAAEAGRPFFLYFFLCVLCVLWARFLLQVIDIFRGNFERESTVKKAFS